MKKEKGDYGKEKQKEKIYNTGGRGYIYMCVCVYKKRFFIYISIIC